MWPPSNSSAAAAPIAAIQITADGASVAFEQCERAETSGSRAEQIDSVDSADWKWAAGQREANDDSGKEERYGYGEGEQGPRETRGERPGHGRRERELHGEANECAEGEGAAEVGQVVGECLEGEAFAFQIHEYGARGQPEHRHADREEGKVIPGDDRKDAGLHDLQHQRAGRDQEKTCVETSL